MVCFLDLELLILDMGIALEATQASFSWLRLLVQLLNLCVFLVYNDIILSDTNSLNFSLWLWILSTTSTILNLICHSTSTIFTLMKSASSPKTKWTILLSIVNILSLLSGILASVSWLIQFYLYLKNNILISKDKLDGWISNDLTTLGYGFYLVPVSILITILNLLILRYIYLRERISLKTNESSIEEKSNGDIMLYWTNLQLNKVNFT